MKTFTFNLDAPIEYHSGGDTSEGNSITFYGPRPNQRKKIAQLKQMFLQSLPKETPNTDGKDKKEQKAITGFDVLMIVASSPTVDYSEFLEIGRSVICDKTGKVDDVEFFTTGLCDKLDIEVMEKMVGEYVANFILRSVMESLNQD